MASKSEEELRRLSVEMRILEQTAEAVQSRLNMVNAVIADLTYESMALDGLEKEKEGSELLVAIGGNSYIKARLENPEKVIVGMGAGVSIEETFAEAKEIVKKRLDDLDKNKTALQQQLAQVAQKMSEDRQRFESLVTEARGEKTPENV